jgi:Zn-dependent protease with chaperone function
MATDFFDRQDYARRQTTRLLVMFVLSVVIIILAIYLVVAVALDSSGARARLHSSRPPYGMVEQPIDEQPMARSGPSYWNPQLFLWVTLGTTAVIALGSLYKIAELSAGGETVALMLGGRPINPQTTDLAERRLLNVVEEMALASGVPVPPVFLLEQEPGINAFAAGHQPGDAVVAVSAGCLKYLTREELQGVMGHEFSHILNGDMRLDLRLIGIVNGILVLAIVGYYLLRSAGSFSSSRDSKRDDSGTIVLILGLAMLVLGYLGVFLGNLIKSAINRQREFLADASAVQFTRYPGGITGALKKIGGLSEGSRIRDGHATEVSHMFFGDAFAGSFFNLFATHPPLAERIRALEPDFDGRFPEVQPVAVTADTVADRSRAGRPASLEKLLPAAAAAAMTMDAGNITRQIGRPQTEHLEQAGQMVADMPPALMAAAREPFAAQALIYALLLSRDDEATCARQLQMLEAKVEPPQYQQTQQLAAAVQSLSAAAALPLVDLSIPALKKSSPQQYARFREVVEALVDADHKVDLFEYSLRTVLFSYLDVNFGLKKPPAVRYRTADAVAQPAAVILATLAYVGQSQAEDVQRAFQAGAAGLLKQATLLPSEQCTLAAFDAALAQLAQASPQVKRAIITAVTTCIAADGKITLKEGELLRAVAAVLACPVPPLPAAMVEN